jgi:hypothetical protein
MKATVTALFLLIGLLSITHAVELAQKRSIPLTQFNFEDLVGKAATTLGAPLTLKKEACLPPQRGACNWQSSLGVRLQILQLDSRVIQVNVMLNGDNPDFSAARSHSALRTACAAVIAAVASDWELKSVRELASKLTAGSTRERHWRVRLERDGLLFEGEQSIPDRGGGFFSECTIMSQ